MFRQVVPGQLGVGTLDWRVAHVPRDVGGHGGTGWAWGWAGPECTNCAERGSRSFPCPSEALAFIAKSSTEVGSLLGSCSLPSCKEKLPNSALKRADRAGLSPRLALTQGQGS